MTMSRSVAYMPSLTLVLLTALSEFVALILRQCAMCQTGVVHSMCACLGQSRKRKFIDHPHVRGAARETKLSLSIALAEC